MKPRNFLFPVLFSIALYLLSKYQTENYSDVLYKRYNSYGNVKNPVIVIIPGLDGAVNFFAEVIPELTVNYHVVVFQLPLLKKGMDTKSYTFEYFASELHTVLTKDLELQSKVSHCLVPYVAVS